MQYKLETFRLYFYAHIFQQQKCLQQKGNKLSLIAEIPTCWLSGVGRRVERRRRLRNTLHEKQNHYHLHNYIIFYYIYLATSVTQKLNLKITQVFYKQLSPYVINS